MKSKLMSTIGDNVSLDLLSGYEIVHYMANRNGILIPVAVKCNFVHKKNIVKNDR